MGIYKSYDIRGIYGVELTEKDAYMFGFYLADHLKIKEIKIAHDLRLSHETLCKFLMQGLIDAKCEITYLGKSSTPNFYFSLFNGINTGIMITASHNDKEYNGFKIMYNGNSFDSRNGLKEIEKIVKEDAQNKTADFELISDSLKAKPLFELLDENEIENNSTLKEYIEYISNMYEILLNENERTVLSSIKITFDFSSGMSSIALIPFLENTKINYQLLNEKPNGNFPSHSPNPLNVGDYIKNHAQDESFISVVFDGDGDRIGFFDENKEFIMTDYVIAKFIDYFSKGKNNNCYAVDLRVTKTISEMSNSNEIKINLIKVGRAYYKDFLDEYSCIFAGELSGHLFFRDFHNLDNPDIALIYMLKFIAIELIENDEVKISDLFKKYKKYYKIPETNIKVKDADKAINALKDKFKDNITLDIDGISLDFKEYWYNVRKSNTEPLLRINFEGIEKKKTEKEMDKLVEWLKKL